MKVPKWKKALRRRYAPQKPTHRCPNCGQLGSHYAPPSLGEPGFYTCRRKPVEAEIVEGGLP